MIKKSKRYDLISAFLPLLDLDQDAYRCEEFDKLYAKAILAENQEEITQLELHLKRYLNNNNIAYYYGRISIKNELPSECGQDFLAHLEYREGLVSVDNLDLLLALDLEGYNLQSLYKEAGASCAKRVMDHFGYSSDIIECYVKGAFRTKNKETITHLWLNVENKEILSGLIKYNLPADLAIVPYEQWLIANKYLILDQEDWEDMNRNFPLLYTALEQDV